MNPLQKIADDMKDQDNFATAHPIYYVREEGAKVVQPFFSMKAAQAYIEANSHNLTHPHVYVGSAYRNKEWQAVREFLLQLNGEK